MAEGFIQLPLDGAGKKLLTHVFGDLYAEGVVLVDPFGDPVSSQNPRSAVLSAASLAAGASVDLDAADITTGRTGHLIAVDVASSQPLKFEVQQFVSPTPTNRAVGFTSYDKLTERWRTPEKRFVSLAGAVGSRFRVKLTNLGLTDPADVYATIYWDEVV